MSLETLWEYTKNADFKWIVLGVLCGFLSHVSRAYRWLFMAEPLGYKPKLANSFMAVYSAYLINFTIPRAGEIARATILSNYEEVPFEKGFGTIVSERIADLIMMLLIIGITLILQFEFIVDFFISKFNPISVTIILVSLFVLLSLFFIILKKSNTTLAYKIKNFINGLIEGALSIFKMKQKWLFLLHTVFIWVMYVAMFYITSFAIEDLNNLPIGAILIGFILASFSIAATNGGIGSFPEAVVIGFLLFNLPEDPSRAFGWIMWSSQTIMIIVVGGLSLLFLPIYNKQFDKKKPL